MADPTDSTVRSAVRDRPSGVSGVSSQPCRRPAAFQSLGVRRGSDVRLVLRSITTDGSRHSTLCPMARIRLFAAARDAAGTGRDELPGDTVGEVLTLARQRYGATFDAVLKTCRIWVNGEPAEVQDTIRATDELAVLPPVSGG